MQARSARQQTAEGKNDKQFIYSFIKDKDGLILYFKQRFTITPLSYHIFTPEFPLVKIQDFYSRFFTLTWRQAGDRGAN